MSRLYWLKDRELLARNYRVVVAGRERVAERPAVVVEIRPERVGRPSVIALVDEETGLLLGLERRDYRGESVYRSRFLTLLLDPRDEETTDKPRRDRSSRRPPFRPGGRRGERKQAPEFERLEAKYVPGGFERKKRFDGSFFGRPGRHEMFGDGLCWLAMSQHPAEAGAEERVVEHRQWGDRVVLTMVHRGVEVKLVGGLDPEEMIRMIRSLAPAEQEDL
jgi:negative regulator of sigma E activity